MFSAAFCLSQSVLHRKIQFADEKMLESCEKGSVNRFHWSLYVSLQDHTFSPKPIHDITEFMLVKQLVPDDAAEGQNLKGPNHGRNHTKGQLTHVETVKLIIPVSIIAMQTPPTRNA